MSLPKLHSAKYTLELPSTGKKVEYRPFTVKDHKALMIAKASEDKEVMIKTTNELIINCTNQTVDPQQLTMFDLEYIFLKLRASSVGETSDVLIKCEKCDHKEEVILDLNDIEVKSDKKVDKKIQLADNIGMLLKYPIMKDAIKLADIDENSTDDLIKTVIMCIDTIYDKESVYNPDDYSEKELVEFIEAFSTTQLQTVSDFIKHQPAVSLNVNFKCKKCSHNNELTIKGLQNFF